MSVILRENLLPETEVSRKPKFRKRSQVRESQLSLRYLCSEESPRKAVVQRKKSKKSRCHCPLSPLPAAMVNTTMFFDISADDQPLSCVSFQLLADKVPKTAEKFCALSTREKEYGYNGSSFHRIIPGFMRQGGDFTYHNGTGGRSIYKEKFEDENFILKHTGLGIFVHGKCWSNTNGSQCF
ncbi:hypothetical protein STEG23_003128 [Scotinomys teguina]